MGRIQRFEDLVAWQKAMSLAVAGYRLTRQRPVSRDFAFVDQSSCAEVHLGHELEYIDRAAYQELREQAREVGRIIGGLRTKVATQRPTSKR